MIESLELFLLGFATVVDTVLLLILLERGNQSLVAIWLKLLIFSAWLTHSASFLHGLQAGTEGAMALRLDQCCMGAMALGLLLMPISMLHAALRLNHTGAIVKPKRDLRYLALYLPLLGLPAILISLTQSGERDFLTAVEPIIPFYMTGFLLGNSLSAFLFYRVRNRIQAPAASNFFQQLSLLMIGLTLLGLAFAIFCRGTPWERTVRLMVQLSPLLTISLFVWYALRRRLLPLVIERTLVYGALLTIVLLIHELFVSPVADRVGQRTHFDFVWIEAGLILAGILAWKPLRGRVLEGLRYLLSNNIFETRNAVRRISIEMSKRATHSTDELRVWMEGIVQKEIGLEFVRIWLVGEPTTKMAIPSVTDGPEIQSALNQLHHRLRSTTATDIDRSQETDPSTIDAMVALNSMNLFRLRFESIDGLALLGNRNRSDRFNDEQVSSLSLLFDQFAVTLHNRWQEQQRMQAERKSMQQEKLSVLGLMAGSMAHELRNPLSSIRTIATLLHEDLGTNHPHARDVGMIIEEIDRLTQSTQRLLDYSRPAEVQKRAISPDRILERLMHILSQLARQYNVSLDIQLSCGGAMIEASDASVSEILFNIIRNAIEAARDVPNGNVTIRSEIRLGEVAISVFDNGNGIDPELQDSLFLPFVTAKLDGTGLGLYVAAERVRELRGTITCRSQDSGGTLFEVRLPFRGSMESQPEA